MWAHIKIGNYNQVSEELEDLYLKNYQNVSTILGSFSSINEGLWLYKPK